jgi:predicted TIM-barrel fold metal-dependent hydrolase
MKTPWRDIAVSDAHVHFLSPGFFAALARQKGAPISDELSAAGFEAPQGDASALAARWVEELDRHGVTNTVLIGSVPGDEKSVIGAVRSFPDRFYGFFMIDPTQPDAAERADAALDEGLRGICFFPAMQGYSIQDKRVLPIFELISRHPGVAAFVHCGVLSVGIRSKLGLASRFDMRFSNPLDLHALALQFPRVNFIIPHFGAGFFREALMVADLCPNVYFDTSGTNSWIKYQTPMMEVRDAFRRSIDLLGSHRLLFGTDSSYFPRGWNRPIFDAQINVLFDLGVGTDDADLILGGNLRRILGTAD